MTSARVGTDYCVEGKEGVEMYTFALERVFSTKAPKKPEDRPFPEKWEDGLVPSLWLMQICRNFPWVDISCTPLRCMLSHRDFTLPKGGFNARWAPDCLGYLMAVRLITITSIEKALMIVLQNPPLWYKNWKTVVQKVVKMTQIICISHQIRCTEIADLYIYARDKKPRLNEKEMNLISEGTLREYFNQWEFSFGKLKHFCHEALVMLMDLSEYQQEPPEGEENAQKSLKRLEKFMQATETSFRDTSRDAELFQFYVDDMRREILTLGFRCHNDLSLSDYKKLMVKAAELEDAVKQMMAGGGEMRATMRKTLDVDPFQYMKFLIKDLDTKEYPAPPPVVSEEEKKPEEPLEEISLANLTIAEDQAAAAASPSGMNGEGVIS